MSAGKAKATLRIRVLRTAVVVLLCVVFGRISWEFICGNRFVNFYGQIVDEAGHPIPNVEIQASVRHSDSPLPNFSKQPAKNVMEIKVYTNAQGNFEITRQFGNTFRINYIQTKKNQLRFAGKPPYPPSSFIVGDIQLPSSAAKRMVYVMRPAE